MGVALDEFRAEEAAALVLILVVLLGVPTASVVFTTGRSIMDDTRVAGHWVFLIED